MRRSSIGVIGTSEILKLKIYSRAADLRSQERYALSIKTNFIKEVIIIQKISTELQLFDNARDKNLLTNSSEF